MAIEVNGVTLPDIPTEVLENYPHVGIIKKIYTNTKEVVAYELFASSQFTFIGKELLSTLGGTYTDAIATLAGYQKCSYTEGNTNWIIGEEYSGMGMNTIGSYGAYTTFFIWSNMDVYELTQIDMSTGQYQLGDVYFRALSDETEYRVPATSLIDIANKIRSIISPIKGLTLDEIRSELSVIAETIRIADFMWIANASLYEHDDFTDSYTLHSDTKKAALIDSLVISNRFKITILDLPNAIELGDCLIENHKTLQTVNAPNAKYIGWGCFSSCSELTFVDSKATLIYNYAFSGCTSLTTLIIRNDTTVCDLETDDSSIFDETPILNGTGYIYVPASLIDAYKASAKWSNCVNQFRALEDYTVDGTITGELDDTKI